MTNPRIQRVAAYNLCVDAQERLLLCRLSAQTERPGHWTLPGGGVEFAEHPEAAAIRELREETGLEGRIVELLAVDSIARLIREGDDGGVDYHSVRIVYRTEIVGGTLQFETDGSSDRAKWCTAEQASAMPLVELGRLGAKLAFEAR